MKDKKRVMKIEVATEKMSKEQEKELLKKIEALEDFFYEIRISIKKFN